METTVAAVSPLHRYKLFVLNSDEKANVCMHVNDMLTGGRRSVTDVIQSKRSVYVRRAGLG